MEVLIMSDTEMAKEQRVKLKLQALLAEYNWLGDDQKQYNRLA
jgi:hypothetical protein